MTSIMDPYFGGKDKCHCTRTNFYATKLIFYPQHSMNSILLNPKNQQKPTSSHLTNSKTKESWEKGRGRNPPGEGEPGHNFMHSVFFVADVAVFCWSITILNMENHTWGGLIGRKQNPTITGPFISWRALEKPSQSLEHPPQTKTATTKQQQQHASQEVHHHQGPPCLQVRCRLSQEGETFWHHG